MTKNNSKQHKKPIALAALRRAAKRALEDGLQTGMPVYVLENGRVVDFAKKAGAKRKTSSRKTAANDTKPKPAKKPSSKRSNK